MIEFKKVKLQNFLSIGNIPVEFDLNDNNLTLIIGKNGSGKSIFLDGIFYGLFGKSFRNINNSCLVNRINKKNLNVEIDFVSRAGKQVKIVRGIKPQVFYIEINGVRQPEYNKNDMQTFIEDELIGFDEKIFRQLCLLGSDLHIPFLKLTLAERRKVIEQIFSDLQVIPLMKDYVKNKKNIVEDTIRNKAVENRIVSEKIDNLKSELNRIKKYNFELEEKQNIIKEENKEKEIKYKKQLQDVNEEIKKYENSDIINKENIMKELKIEEEKIESIKNEFDLKKEAAKKMCSKTFAEGYEHNDYLEKNIKVYEKNIKNLETDIYLIDKDPIDKEFKEKNDLYTQEKIKIDLNLVNINDAIRYYKENDCCDVCKTELTIEYKEKMLKDLNDRKKLYENNLIDLKNKIELIKNELKERIDKIRKPKIEQKEAAENVLKEIHIQLNENNKIIEDLKQKREKDFEKINEDLQLALQNNTKKILEYNKKLNEIEVIENKIAELNKRKEAIDDILKDIEKKLKNNDYKLMDESEVINKLSENEKQKLIILDGIEKQKNALIYIEEILKMFADDKLRASLIERYLPVLNKKLSEFLTLFNINYSIKFNNELDTIITFNREELDFSAFSSGQRQRINLAILFTFMSFTKMKNNVSTNLMIFDEILDSSLDEDGADTLFEVLNQICAENYTVFVISHRATNLNRFNRIIEVKMKDNFSKYSINNNI